MKRSLWASVVALALIVPAVAIAKPPTRAHLAQYERDYHAVAHKLGHRAPGRNIARWGLATRRVTDADIVTSLGVLDRMLHPPSVSFAAHVPGAYGPTQVSWSAPATSTTGSTDLVACIISHESGGNSQAVSPGGKYKGIGQWQDSTWLSDGGGRYSSTALGATYGQQLAVLEGEGAAGQRSQQAQYDHCLSK